MVHHEHLLLTIWALSMLTKLHNQNGQSLLELLIAMAIFVLVVSSIMFLVLDTHTANRLGGEHTKAALMTQEGYEGVMSIRNSGWRNLTDGDFGLDASSGQWELQGAPNIIDNRYVRKVTIGPVNRDGTGAIVETGGTVDFDTKKVTTTTNWDFTTARHSEITLEAYLTNWRSLKWKQTTQAEFDLGIKRQVVSTATDDGELELDQTGGALASYDWTFDVPAEYTYDSNKIELSASRAQLRMLTGSSGGTSNSSFDADLPPWTYSDWNQGGGEVNVTGTWDSPAGNPGGFANITIPSGKSDEVGGFFEQSFVVSQDNPTTAYIDFDATVSNFNGNPQRLQLYVFVDNTPGEPLTETEVWTSGPLGGTMPWTPFGSIDITSRITTSGTYYIKLAVWVETPKQQQGPYTIGYDNALVYWETTGSGYPTDSPPIQPTTSFQPASISTWSSFQETATKNGGEIYYQLSDDDGTIWQYWDGGAWAIAGAADYNIATVINSNIATFPTTNSKLMFKAFLSSDGSQLVQLDTVRVTYDAVSQLESTFDVPAEYTYDGAKIEVVGSNAQLIDLGGGSVSGGTSNSSFDTDLPPWTYSDWNQGGGEVNVTGTWDTPAGNPGGFAYITIPSGKSDEVGGFFEQSFDVTENNPTTAYVQFDFSTLDFNGNPNTLQAYVFVDNASGQPAIGTEVWSSGEITGTSTWASFGPIDVTSKITIAGTYYVKIAVWVETPKQQQGPYTIGYDNALVYWETTGSGYPTDSPPIQPTTSFQPASISTWSSFQETATKNGGEIYYQLSDDDGTIWQYWDGGAWAIAGAADYNIATVINSNIATFPTTNSKLMFKAFLSSDGSQLVQLDTVRIEYIAGGVGGYYTDGTFESSTFDTTAITALYNYIDWTADEPSGARVEFQLRTASTEAGLSSALWVGPDGTGSSFYTVQGEIIETDPTATGTRWIQYRAYFYSDGSDTPVLYDITIDYET